MTLEEAKEQARRTSEEEGVTQHVNRRLNGEYYVSDWYDSDATVTSYTYGEQH